MSILNDSVKGNNQNKVICSEEMELVTIIQNAARGNRNPRKPFKEFGTEKAVTLSTPFIESEEETVLALILNWMANKGKSGDKFNIRIHAEETTYTSVARIYATRMTVTLPIQENRWNGKTLYVWKSTDCYHNLTALSLKQSAKKAKVLNWQLSENFDDTITELLTNDC